MSVSPAPDHLPSPFPDPEGYSRAYEFVRRVEGVYHGDPDDWRELRIPPGSDAGAVYRVLPVAHDFEYAGYLTPTRVRYAAGWDSGAYLMTSKPCTFHTHPQGDPHADLPSFKDLYAFLRYTHLRHVTVGRSLIWVFDKTAETLEVVGRLNAWEARNMLDAVAEFGFDHYAEVALRGVGFRLPQGVRRYGRFWPARAWERLGIQVTLLNRRP